MAISNPWFKRLEYGWGWGFPRLWQGWLTLATYLVLLVLSAVFFKSSALVVSISSLTLLYSAVVILTGESPRWSWGRKDSE